MAPRELTLASQPSALLDLEGRELDFSAPVRMVGFLGDTFVAATGDGKIGFVESDSPLRLAQVHGGAILSATVFPSRQALLTAGDDVLLRLTGLNGESETIATSPHWIDSVAASSTGWIAWSSRKTVRLHKLGGAEIVIETASSCQSLAFSPDGSGLAIAQYGGIWLIDLQRPKKKPPILEWKGAHLRVRWSPTIHAFSYRRCWRMNSMSGKWGAACTVKWADIRPSRFPSHDRLMAMNSRRRVPIASSSGPSSARMDRSAVRPGFR